MKSLVVIAPSSNPQFETVVQAAARAAVAALEAKGHDVTLVDLKGFSPVLTRLERRAYETEHPLVDEVVTRHAASVRATDALVFVYATSLAGLPAELKGWLDRVLVPGVSFILDDSRRVRRGLTHLDHLVGIAVYEATWLNTKRARDPGRRIIMRVLRGCGRLTLRTSWLPLYSTARADDVKVQQFVRRIEQGMAKL